MHLSFLSRNIAFTWIAAVFLFLVMALSSRADQFDTLRIYWQTNLIAGGGSVSSITSTANSDWSSMDTNASRTYLWSDLPFGSVSANLVTTYQRLEAMAMAWATPGSSLQNNAGLAAAVSSGLDWMNTHVYTSTATEYDNWFHWEISGPQALNNTEVLLYPALTGTQITNYNTAVDHYAPGASGATYGWMTGANTSDKVLVMAIRGILGKNAALVTLAQTNLSPVFPYVTSSDGFYPDGSFVFHSNIAYTGHYGLVLLGDIPTLVNLFFGSQWQITDPNLTNIYNWVSNSFEPLIYNGAMMDMVRGRAASWSYETETEDASSAISATRQIAHFAPAATAAALTSWANSPHLPPGQFHFASMDRVVALRTNFGFGLSMCSSRIANYESINGGNLHGWFTGDGMTYLYLGNTDTQFDSDFWPTVDPYHLPGTTVETNSRANSASEAKTTSQNWVGGAQVGKAYGVAGMSLASINTTLVGKKSWFMLDNEIVCLGAGITCGDAAGVDTTVEDRRLGTSPTNSLWVNGTKVPPVMGWSSNLTSSVSWCALDGVGGYYFPSGAGNLQASFAASSGSWIAINDIDSSTVYTDDYLKLIFNAGIKPTNATYAYVLLPNFTATSVSNYALSPDLVVLTNSAIEQAVRKPALGVVAANFWTTGNNSADIITVNNKSSVITRETATNIAVGIADPTQTNTGSITVTLNRAALSVFSADPGVTVSQLSPHIVFSVNVNGSLGKTFQATFSYQASILPAITGVYPNGTNMFQPAAALTFNASSPAGISISTNAVTLAVAVTNLLGLGYTTNITATNGLSFSGVATNWNVGYPLLSNAVYKVTINVTDANGSPATSTIFFDTCNPSFTWEAEDYNHDSGKFIDNPATDGYAGLGGTEGIDTHAGKISEGTLVYRPSGLNTEVNTDTPRLNYLATSAADYDVGWNDSANWGNYTRTWPAGAFNLYMRAANGSTGAGNASAALVREGAGTTSQTLSNLGTFAIPNTGGWQAWTWVPLRDSLGNVVQLNGGGVNTVRITSGGGYNANFYAFFPVTTLPVLAGVFPNGGAMMQSTNTLGFNISSPVGVATSNIVVTINGALVTNLGFSGSATNWNVSYPHLQPSQAYVAVITVTDANGNVTTTTKSFDTFGTANYTWEAEDFDFNAGHFFDNPQTNKYSGAAAGMDIDTHQVNFAGTDLYRPNGMDTEINGDIARPQYLGTGFSDYSLGYFSAGSWANYTRNYPAGSYNVYARLAAGGGNTTCTLARVTGGWGTTNQTTDFLGTFFVANSAYESYSLVPLEDAAGQLVTVKFDGSTNTLRLGRPATATTDCNANFLMLVPIFALNAAPNGTNVMISPFRRKPASITRCSIKII